MKTTTSRPALVGLTVAALVALPMAATAAPFGSALADILPDADMFCDGDTAPVDGFVGHPSAATLWIDDADHGGHYVLESSDHYFAPGLLHEPTDTSTLPLVGAATYGQRKGIDHAMTCQVVSRWAHPQDPAQHFTILADVELAGPVGRS